MALMISKDNFRYLNELKIKPVIKIRRNSSTNANGCIPRKLVVAEQLENVKRWKKKMVMVCDGYLNRHFPQ
jgi:hypothetical protein